MLTKILIKNFALIDHLDISLQNGLQVITGETGAGKSIILGALRLLLGQRADSKSVTAGEKKSIIEGTFLLEKTKYLPFFEQNDLDFEPHTIIRREVLASGKSRAFIGDSPVTLSVLQELTSQLIDIHSQFETSNLFSQNYQFSLLDSLSGNQLILEAYTHEFHAFQQAKQTLQELLKKEKEDKKEADYNAYLLQELQQAELEQTNFEQIKQELLQQENAENIGENIAASSQLLYMEDSGVLSLLNHVKSKLQKIASFSSDVEAIYQRVDQVNIELEDVAQELENSLEKVQIDPQLLTELQDKINNFQSLLVKHGARDSQELLDIQQNLEKQLSSSETRQQEIKKTEKQLEILEKSLEKKAKELSDNRKKHAPIFAKKTQQILGRLAMEKAQVKIELTPKEEFGILGKENIAILFQANKGYELNPIETAVSGGERSRVMLAIKKIMAENSQLPTLILDEIDTGVSGKVAEEIGVLMQEMGKDLQLITITHLAQVAAKGNNNYQVKKSEKNGKTQTTIVALSEEEKLQEIAQLLSGSTVTQAAIEQAKELIAK